MRPAAPGAGSPPLLRRALSTAGLLLAATLVGVASTLAAEDTASPSTHLPVIALVIDDLGNLRTEGLRALELPGRVTYGFLPHTPHAAALARLAYLLDKEVMVHVPMQSRSGHRLGPGALTASMSQWELRSAVRAGVDAVPHARGLSNHMGSLLTTQQDPMTWLMAWLRERGDLYFFDSRTAPDSVALRVARDTGVVATERDVFLDHERDRDVINRQFDRLLEVANQRGRAVGIGHPYPETIEILQSRLRRLGVERVQLVKMSELLERDHQAWSTQSRLTQ